jgi:hypothetical protein
MSALDCRSILPPFFRRLVSIFNLASNDLDNALGSLARPWGNLHLRLDMRHIAVCWLYKRKAGHI